MALFKQCRTCGHIEENHAFDAPEGERECLEEGCSCKNFEPDDQERELVPA